MPSGSLDFGPAGVWGRLCCGLRHLCRLVFTIKQDGGLDGTFDKGGKLVTALTKDRNGWEGIWTADEAPKECESEKNGSSYWGNVSLTVAEGGRVLTGKWGYCDADPDVQFKAELESK